MRRDEAYLLDILIAAKDACEFIAGLTWDQFEKSRLLQYSIIKALEIIGEAARRISEETREEHPELPWLEMSGMRNRLVHGYFELDLKAIWDTVHEDLPPLIVALETIIPPEESL